MATVDVTNQPVVVEATNDVAVVSFTENSAVVEVPNPQPVVEFTAGGTLTAGTGLVGGGYLTGAITLGLSPAAVASLAKADSAVQPGANLSSFVNDLNLATSSVLTDAIAALSTVYQPLNANLTSVAGLLTTAFGRSFLELADAAASRSLIGVYSTSQVYTKSEVNVLVAAGLIPVWGTITGNILDQTDLQFALSAKSSIGHDHVAAAITSGIIAPARLGSGVPDNTKFLRGDSTWVALSGDHGGLTGLADDDHTQYYNQTRGDARYSQLGHTHSYYGTAGGDLTGSISFLGTTIGMSWWTGATPRYAIFQDYNSSTKAELAHYNGSNWISNLRWGAAGTDFIGAVSFDTAPTVSGAAVSTAGHTHSYLPLAGGALTGVLSLTTAGSHITFYESDGPDPADRVVFDLNSGIVSLYGHDASTNTWQPFLQGTVASGALNLIAGTTIGGTGVSLVGHTHSYLPLVGGTVSGYTTFENATDTSIATHVELRQAEGTVVRPVYLRFHQENRWYYRIRGNANGFAVVGGATDTYTNLYAGSLFEDDVQLSSKYAALAHSHAGIGVVDTRAAQILPSGYGAYSTYAEFTDKLTGLTDWQSAFTVKGWTNGYSVWQIIGPSGTTANSKFYLRSGLDGTWNPVYEILHTGNAVAANNYLWNNAGGNHGDVVDFDAVTHFGPKYVQATTNGPAVPSATQYYSWSMGLGANYPWGPGIGYAAQFAVPRTPVGGNPVLSVRFREAGSWGAWSGIWAQGLWKTGGYYIDAANGSQWRVVTSYGYMDIGPANATWCHFSTDRSAFYFGNALHVNGSIYRYGTNYAMDSDGFYLDASSSRIRANAYTYTAHEIVGSKNSYCGFYLNSAAVNIMYDAAGNGGVYRPGTAVWHYYWSETNGCLGIDGSGTSSSYSLYVNGAVYATGNIVAYSDERSKENIKTIDGALERVRKMRGVFYTKKGDATRVEQLGVIAQEVQVVLPQAVTYAADVDQYGVHYGNIVGVLIEAIKDQQRQIDELKRQH